MITSDQQMVIKKEIARQAEELEARVMKKIEELVDGVHEHLDEHLEAMTDDILDNLDENFKDLRGRIAVVEKLERMEKRVDRIETATQRYKV